MNNKLIGTALMVLVVALAGVGCKDNSLINSKPSGEENGNIIDNESTETTETDNNESTETESSTDTNGMKFSANPIGNGQIKLEWEVTKPTPEWLLFVRSPKENPVHDGKNYWFMPGSARKDATWRDVPAGTYYIRMCLIKDNQCSEYSDNVRVEVK